jgi:hypothetical protein
MDELSEMFGVNFFMVSQVNPYVIPFVKGLQKRSPFEVPKESTLARFKNFCQGNRRRFARPTAVLMVLTGFLKSEIHHRCVQMTELGVAPRLLEFLVPVMKQSYSGDVTIVPEFRNCLKNYMSLLSNPTDSSLQVVITIAWTFCLSFTNDLE